MTDRRAVIFLNGDLSDVEPVRDYITKDTLLIGCDGGTNNLLNMGYTPNAVIGDFDSFEYPADASHAAGDAPVYLRYPTDKDVTDAELALDYAAEQGCGDIVLTGTLGTRLDHVLGNVFLLTKRKFSKLHIMIVEGGQTAYLIRGRAHICGKKGDTISFIPIKGTARVAASRGLKYDLAQYQLSLQGNTGISNILTAETAEVLMRRGVLLAVHQRG